MLHILNESAHLEEDFKSFAHLNALNASEYTQSVWIRARSQYEEGIAPLEDRVARKIKEIFRKELHQYAQFINRN